MKLNLIVENEGKVVLTDREYLASGGEANIYVKDKTAYKIYHDLNKMIPLSKIQELNQLTPKNVLKPQNIIRDNSKPVGYTMAYIRNTHPLCKLFTLTFKQANKITNDDIVALVKEIQLTIKQIHKDGCLIVDLNELNLLVSSKFDIPYFIDVDSYQSPSHKATAIMESIRDRQIKNNKFTELSDWFSFAVLAIQLYLGIHPYKGKHPDYKPTELNKRMEDGISIFDKKVTIPRICSDFSVIPKRHRDWFEAIFVRNERSEPPMADGVVIVIPTPDLFIESTEDFETKSVFEIEEKIVSVFNFMGVNYVVGDRRLYKDSVSLPNDTKDCKVLFCESSDMSPIVCKLRDEFLTFEDTRGGQIDSINATQVMYRNGAIYSMYEGRLIEHTFDKFGERMVHKTRIAANVMDLSTKVFEGVVFQDLLGKCYITLPYEKGKCLITAVEELNGYRILEAKSERSICVVIAEKKGIYYRFVMIFDKDFKQYGITKTDNVSYDPINFTVLPTGLCIMAIDSDIHVFKGNQVKVISNSPLDSNMKLYNSSGGVFFIDGKKIYAIKMKK